MHACHEDVHVLRFLGDIRYTLTPSIEHFLEELFAEAQPEGFVIDLTDTDSIDSTNLGLLVQIAKRMQGAGRPRLTIVSRRRDINSVLNSMALNEVFDIVEDSSVDTRTAQEVPLEESDRESMAQSLIQAHRALMELSEHNRELFRDVVASLEKNTRGQ
jgi:anti-anti-sigma factor